MMEKNKSNYPEFYLSLSVLRDIYARCRLLFLLLAGSFLFINSIYAQTVTVTGKVVDENGDPLIGANIIEKDNPSNGTVTNEDGYYSIQTDKGRTLRF
ncbi:MAG TPA: hypothetical protein GXX42_14680, partial [Petrimonas sp.]|uniref:carboxypeptidase-like regulatory domain-containing protein n=1 Tax=Petrimonas sp. TaxID=2023866 RepID=UPI00176359E5|nr:hypothetical protein [Petrimonas sp.]